MALQPVEATLIVGTASVLASTSAVLITHRLTIRRDRQHRVWDRRMDTYKEVLRTRRILSQHRTDVLRTQSAKSAITDVEGELNAFHLTQAQLTMFGSNAIKALDTISLAAFNNWSRALSQWSDLNARATAHLSNREMWEVADRKWAELQELAKTVDLADQLLAKAIRDEAEFKDRLHTPWWSRMRARRRDAAHIASGDGTPPTPPA
ncbi:hypothetical protein ACFZCP_06015 [Streptomyces sp. NPDC007971]|uniref:hypothetical protein n=1 Tax=Streptomyces sp. NPDC007971 TaxID=3364799 RepID=UPI0036E4FE02